MPNIEETVDDQEVVQELSILPSSSQSFSTVSIADTNDDSSNDERVGKKKTKNGKKSRKSLKEKPVEEEQESSEVQITNSTKKRNSTEKRTK